MTPRQALSNIIVAVTGNDLAGTGLFLGSVAQHTRMQDALEVLTQLVQAYEEVKAESPKAAESENSH